MELGLGFQFRLCRNAVEVPCVSASSRSRIGFAGDPVGPQIAFLEHVDADAQWLQRLNGGAVIRPAIA